MIRFRSLVVDGLAILPLLVCQTAVAFEAYGPPSIATGTHSERAPAPTVIGPARKGAAFLTSLRARAVPFDSVLRVAGVAGGPEPPLPQRERKVRVGATREVGASVDFSALRPDDLRATPRAIGPGAIRAEEGGFAWTGAVESPGAAALRIRFASFFLPRNAELYLYGDEGDVFGPYTGRGIHGDGEFWSPTLLGSRVTLHLSYGGTDTARALQAARFVIADIGRLDDRFLSAVFGPSGEPAASNLCSFNADCVENASDASIPAAIQPAQQAAARIVFVSGAYLYLCSGGLIADTDTSGARPLFLTANHCLSKRSEARSLEAYFQFTTPVGGSCEVNAPRTLGATVLATGRRGDFTLLELDEQPPAGSVLLGWSSSPVAFAGGTPLFRISHPRGAPQAYSEHVVDVSRATCQGWPRGERIYSTDAFGATEGGSSGAPVLNAAGQIIGQLSGACGYNVGDVCDSVQNATVDGALAYYFSDVEPFLDPPAPCPDADNDGWCAADDCDDSDSAISPGAVEICDDSRDNDCDGQVDGNDADCQTGACDLLPVGAACDAPDQCCSQKCKGKPGQKRCR